MPPLLAWVGNMSVSKHSYISLFVLLLCLFETTIGKSDDLKQPKDEIRPKIGLALSGGGARGAAHVGVLRQIEDKNIPIDYIAGTSMGALVGGLYASGLSASEIEVILNDMNWDDILADKAPRENRSFRKKRDDDLYLVKSKARLKEGSIRLPSGIVSGQKIDFLLRSLTLNTSDVSDFASLKIPFKALATDLVSGQAVILDSGDLALALRASMSIPAVFTPIEIDGQYLVDGGVTNNLPIDVVKSMGADIVIAVDISSPLLTRDQINNVIGVTEQLTGILVKRNSLAQLEKLGPKDILIAPDLKDITMMDFDRSKEALDIGYETSSLALSPLSALFSDAKPLKVTDTHSSPEGQVKIIDQIHIVNNSQVNTELIKNNLTIEEGRAFDVKQMESDISRLYGWELFESIRYDIKNIRGNIHLTLSINEKETGLSYLQFGLRLYDDFSGENDFDLAVAYTNPYINDLRGEFRAATQIGNEPIAAFELYQPIDQTAKYFIQPRLFYQKQTVLNFENDGITSEFNVETSTADVGFGRNLSHWGELKTGIRLIDGRASIRVGDPDFEDIKFKNSEIYASFTYDKLDSISFPQNGAFWKSEFKQVNDGFGHNGDDQFNQLMLTGVLANTWDKHTFILKGRYGTTFDDDAPIQSLFRLGGFTDLSGFSVNELSGQHLGLVSGTYFRRLGADSIQPIYLGGSLELGNVWQHRDDISINDTITAGSIFLGVDSLLGPVYLAYGRAENGVDTYHLYLGGFF